MRLVDYGNEAEKQGALKEAIANPDCGWFYRRDASSFSAIPGTPIAYWASDAMIEAFGKGKSIEGISDFTGSQNITGDNERFLRLFWELPVSQVFGNKARWIPYAKGGDYRRWYGNREYLVDWSEDARAYYKNNATSNLIANQYWFKNGITYNAITSGRPHFRYLPADGVFDKGGPTITGLDSSLDYVLAFLNSAVCNLFLSTMNPTLNLQVKDIKSLPLLIDESSVQIQLLSKRNVEVATADWNSFETSWDFQRHPMVGD